MSCCSNNPEPEKKSSPNTSAPLPDLMNMDFRKATAAETSCSETGEQSCCCTPKVEEPAGCCGNSNKVDWVLWVSLIACTAAVLLHLFGPGWLPYSVATFSSSVSELLLKMWWGLAIGVVAVGVMGKIPREFVQSILGNGGTLSGILRATGAGLLLDLCNHGILLVAMRLYERGASLGQTFAFIIASPWNSLSLTLILVGLIGLKWTIVFVLLSAVIAIITGYFTDKLVLKGRIPSNPNTTPVPEDFSFWHDAKQGMRSTRYDLDFVKSTLIDGVQSSKSIIKWVLFGAVLAAAVRSFVDTSIFHHYFGPTALGVCITLLAATVIEVCSEGSSPLAADLVTRAKAPGNGFAFLMAGAATDYTEIMALKETTKSWKATFLLPLLTLPQVAILAIILNKLA